MQNEVVETIQPTRIHHTVIDKKSENKAFFARISSGNQIK